MPDCTCPDVKTALVTALHGRPQPDCPDHPRADDGERLVTAIPLNGRPELRAQILADLTKEPTQ